jgi:hypothetical protein
MLDDEVRAARPYAEGCICRVVPPRVAASQWCYRVMTMMGWQQALGLEAPFLTGVGHECSAPLVHAEGAIVRRARGKHLRARPPVVRMDQLALCGHLTYAGGSVVGGHWRRDLELSKQFGDHVRYGFPWWRDRAFDWAWADQVVSEAERLGLHLIVDCLHYGIPLRLGGVWGPAVADQYAAFMRRFVRRYRGYLRYFTPVNEMFISVEASTREGHWNNAVVLNQTGDADFVAVLGWVIDCAHAAWAVISDAIPDAVTLDSDPCDNHPGDPLREELKYVGWDLFYGIEPEPIVIDYLQRHGMSDARLGGLLGRGSPDRHIIGFDYYLGNDRAGQGGFYGIARHMLDRFARKAGRRIPCMLAEINGADPWVVQFFGDAWADALRLHDEGDCVGALYYSLIDQCDWDHFANRAHGHVLPIGLHDIDRAIRPVGELMRGLVAEQRERLQRPAA